MRFCTTYDLVLNSPDLLDGMSDVEIVFEQENSVTVVSKGM